MKPNPPPVLAEDAELGESETLEFEMDAWAQEAESAPGTTLEQTPTAPQAEQEPQELVLSARNKLILQCGLSSITLYANGKVVVRGQSIVSAAEGVNRLSGGQIEIN